MLFELDHVKEFRTKLQDLSREELLEIIEEQNPKFITAINRIEWVFRNKMSHIKDNDGNYITERDFTKEELIKLIDPPFVFSKELMKQGFNEATQRELHIASDPVLWARHHLNAEPRVYQVLVLREMNDQVVLRWGRRLGKTHVISLYVLWYSCVNERARTLIMAPMKNQVGVIYEEILDILEKAPEVNSSIVRKVRSPQFEIKFSNGSVIKLFTTGMKSGSKSDGVRGQEADMLILDEMDYMGDEDLVALMAMLQQTNENKYFGKKLIGASTPTGQRNTYWRWNTDKKHGFYSSFFPSYSNPLWNQEEEDKAHLRYTNEQHYRHEIEADWGEDAQGVYPRKYVDIAFDEDNGIGDYDSFRPNTDYYIYTLGVDWDKHGAGVNLAIAQIPVNYKNHPIRFVYREEVRKGEFTYLESIERIKKLDSIFNFEHVYIDQGSGEVQAELLHEYGMLNPHTRFHLKTKACHFSNTIEVRDPFTRQPIKKRLKPFMVDNLVNQLEQTNVQFCAEDEELYLQLISYIKLRETETGNPVFAPGGNTVDHAHDAVLLALYAVTENFDDLFDKSPKGKPVSFSNESFLPATKTEEKPKKVIESSFLSAKRASVGNPRRRTGRGQIRRSSF